MTYKYLGEGGEGHRKDVPRVDPRKSPEGRTCLSSVNREGGISRAQPSPLFQKRLESRVLDVMKIGRGFAVMMKVDTLNKEQIEPCCRLIVV